MSLGLQSLAEWDKPYNQADLTSLLIHLYLTSAEASKKKKVITLSKTSVPHPISRQMWYFLFLLLVIGGS